MVDATDLNIEIEADTGELHAMRESVLAAARRSHVPRSVRDRMIVAVDEAVSNVIIHGTPNGTNRRIGLAVRIRESRFEVSIVDRGEPFNPKDKHDPDIRRILRNGARSGLGLYLINSIVDDIRYAGRQGGMNELTLIKYF